MDFLIDTHALVWVVEGHKRLSAAARSAIEGQGNRLFVSAVTAWEFADLHKRGRLPVTATFDFVIQQLSLRLLDFPADLWRLADQLPNLHGDPADRMLIAHALHRGITLITADVTMRSYPIVTLW